MRRSWLIKKSALFSNFYMAVPVEGDGEYEVFHRAFSPERRANYTVTYESLNYVPVFLCDCRFRWRSDNLGGLRRTVNHHFFWTDESWFELIAWGV
jgi:hypothetical protein